VIGGYKVGGTAFDALILGYLEDNQLTYTGLTRTGFTPRLRADLMQKIRAARNTGARVRNLPKARRGRSVRP
jgi:hypothetical protein